MSKQVTLTREQVKHAIQIMLDLIKKHRIFVAKESPLDLNYFEECIALCMKLRNAYKDQQEAATHALSKIEKALGITPPVLKDGVNIVKCSLYTGGLEICDVYPIERFLAFMPKSYENLYAEMLEKYQADVGGASGANAAAMRQQTEQLCEELWGELQAMVRRKNSIVLMMETKFQPSDLSEFDILKSKAGDLVSSQKALAYLFFKHSEVERLVEHRFVLFGTHRNNHPLVCHWSNEPPELSLKAYGGYDSKVKFACIA